MTEEQITDETTEPAEVEERTYTAPEYAELKEESIRHRLKAKEATEALDPTRDALRAAICREASNGVLHDVIGWDDAFNDDDGLPSLEKAREAAEALAVEKPHLGRVRGDAGQGFRGDGSDAVVDLAGLLRAGA